MSEDITVTHKRNGIPLKAGIALQLDNRESVEQNYYTGAQPIFRFDGYVLGPKSLGFRQSDLLVDLNDIDPITNIATEYRIVNLPEFFSMDQHWELLLDWNRGS